MKMPQVHGYLKSISIAAWRMNMKISFDQVNINQKVENSTTSYRSSYVLEPNTQSGYVLDLTGKGMDNTAYGSQGKTTEDVMQNAEAANVTTQQNYMTIMSNSMSTEDFASLAEDGYRVSEMDVDKVVTVVDQIKVKMAESGNVVTGYNDDMDLDTLTQITGSEILALTIADGFKENDVPATEENVTNVTEALSKADELEPLSEGTVKYMVENDMEPTIENLYKAQYSSVSDSSLQGKGYYADDMGYYSKKAEDYNWEQLQPQIEKTITDAGLDVTEETLDNSKWLIETGIPLTTDSLKLVTDLQELELPVDDSQVVNQIMNALSQGKSADKANLSTTESATDKAVDIMNTVNEATIEDIQKVMESGKTFTVRNLKAAMERIKTADSTMDSSDETDVSTIDAESTASLITAKRQLEEVRLQMTVEANYKLIKSGYSIDTTQISQLVDDLKKVEQQKSQILFGDDETSAVLQKADLYQETLSKVSEIPAMPAAVIGQLALSESSFTLNEVHESGKILQNTLTAANESYEALMTAPRSDLGDSIKKAFRNVDDILEDMDIETTESNKRAVRILAYNSMTITQDNLDSVKVADQAVKDVVSKMTPSATLQLIRDGINPLSMNVEELNNTLDNYQSDSVSESEKYSKFLYKLEQNDEITEDERSSFIGIYRLFRQVEKTDGAAIGSLVNAGAELSLKNLLSAVRTSSKSGIDITINDEFGILTDVKKQGTSIDDQIAAGFNNASDSANSNSEKKENYYKQLASDLYQTLSPEGLKESVISPDMSLEQLYENLQNMEEENSDYYKSQLEQVRETTKVEESVIRDLLDNNQPITVDNVLAASGLASQKGSVFSKIWEQAEDTDQTDSLESSIEELKESMVDETSTKTAYEQLMKSVEKVLDTALEASDVTAIDLKAITLLNKQISLLTNMSKEENYEVPIKINDEITSINLKIVKNSSESGKVTATMETKEYGSVGASFNVDDNQVSGYVACSEEDKVQQMSEMKEDFENALRDSGLSETILSFVGSSDLDLKNFDKLNKVPARTNTEETTDKISSKQLYLVAKAFIVSLQNNQTNR